MTRLLIMGPPGAGKGTQAVGLAQRIGGAHISTGDIFRENVAKETELGKTAKQYMEAGKYVPDEVTNAMVRDRLNQPDAESFVLDGYPRTADQVDELDSILGDLGAKLDAVLLLVVGTRAVRAARSLLRRLYARGGRGGVRGGTRRARGARRQEPPPGTPWPRRGAALPDARDGP